MLNSLQVKAYYTNADFVLKELVTLNEVARGIGVAHKTAQLVRMQLAFTRDDAKYCV